MEFDYFDDEILWKAALAGNDLRCVLHDFDNALRSVIKHGNDERGADVAQKWRDKLYEIADSNGISIWGD